MARLASRHCTALKKGTTPIRESVAQSLLNQLNPDWHISKNKQAIQRRFKFSHFQETVGFVNAIAWIANREDHHPDLQIGYDYCEVSYTSHIARGLTVNDFICAAKVDSLFRRNQPAKDGIEDTGSPDKEKSANEQKIEQALVFDVAEANALLKKQEKPKAQQPIIDDDDEDEFKLIDPDDEATVKQEAAVAAVASTADSSSRPEKPADKPTPSSMSTSGTLIDPNISKAADDFVMPGPVKSDIDLMSTIILPPGMESVAENNLTKSIDEDEESTVILPDTTATAEIDDKTLIIEPDKDEQDTFINEMPPSDDDPERTLILAPQQIEKITAAVKTSEIESTKEYENSKEENVEKTMVLSSDPTNAVRRLREPPQAPVQNKNSEEDNVEKTMVLSSDPTNAVSRKPTAPAPEQKPQTPEQHQSDPGIEDDETLVMHSNTYKPVKHEPK
ncbi:MAG: 4a-hydroxytetrahydrobiopterin dehydratase [Gammaproteobacteria bacterium]|nr:4a-hydroxytetrahydrobiopterin dehydratase [Gammaproteobacteria bacterium]